MMEHKNINQIQINADLVRCVAISMVVMLHISANSFASFGDNWTISLIYDSLTRSCVPLFFMLSGALLLNKNEPPFIFYKKRLSKIVIPLIFWSYFYLVYRKYYVGEEALSLSPLTILGGPVYYHLWFLYSIISLYIFIPMLRYYSINASREVKILVLSIWFAFQSVNPFMSYAGLDLPLGFDLGLASRFTGFALLGEFLSSTNTSCNNKSLIAIFLASTIVTACLTYYTTFNTGSPNEIWFQYHSPFVVISSVCLFKILSTSKIETGIIKSISKFSFGIYFVHIVIMQQVLVRFIFTPDTFNSTSLLYLIPLGGVLCICISLIICSIISKVAFIRRVI